MLKAFFDFSTRTHELSYKKNHNESAVKFVLLSPRLQLEPVGRKEMPESYLQKCRNDLTCSKF